jgi:colanic acid/amylovoran biosynthesis glycosyltransferase
VRLSKGVHLKVWTCQKLTSRYEPPFQVERLPRPLSLSFLIRVLPIFIRIGSMNIRKAYHLFILETLGHTRIYFPFLSMLKPYRDVLEYSRAKIYTSVRGTDVTVTPFLVPEVVQQYRTIVHKIHKIHFLSENLLECARNLNLDIQGHQIIYQGVNFARFKWVAREKKTRIELITVGRLHYIKGLEFAILACKELKNQGISFHLNIVGDGPQQELLNYMIRSLNLSEEVAILPPVNHDELVTLYHRSNLYIHTHLVNDVSNTMLEAISTGLKVVCHDSGLDGYKHVDFAKSIFQVPRYDFKAMARCIQEVSIDSSVLTNGDVQQILSAFVEDNQVREYVEFFDLPEFSG